MAWFITAHTHTRTRTHLHPNILKDVGRLSNQSGPNKKIKFEFSMLRQLGMFWPFKSEQHSKAVCRRTIFVH